MKRLASITAILVAVWAGHAIAAEPHQEQRIIDQLVLDRTATLQSPVYAQRLWAIRVTEPPAPPIPADWQCAEWYDTTLDAGFSRDDWPAIGIIMWRESRCNPNVHNGSDPNTGSFGLMQINGYWCRGGLRNLGWGSGNHCLNMFDPATNLRAARAIADYDLERDRCPWTQWSTRQGLC
jgi:hypothetical protein